MTNLVRLPPPNYFRVAADDLLHSRTNSPIESILLREVSRQIYNLYAVRPSYRHDNNFDPISWSLPALDGTIMVTPSVKFPVNDQFVRMDYDKREIDFEFVVVGWWKDVFSVLYVECDGYAIHERNPIQAQKDRRRDRHLQSQGANVFRFLGSELTKERDRCALEIINFLVSKLTRPPLSKN